MGRTIVFGSSFFSSKFYEGNFRSCRESYRRPSSARASAHVKIGISFQFEESIVIREKERGDKAKRKDLSFMQMAGELKIKQAFAVFTGQRLVFEENGEFVIEEFSE